MRRHYYQYGIVLTAATAVTFLAAAFRLPYAARRSPTPCTLSYPAYFGNRINNTDDNPLTNEGVSLGRYLFYDKRLSANNSISCGSCHSGPKVFNETYHNNGLDSIPADPGRAGVTGMDYDRGRFRVVTLRNIAVTAPYMHDGRFATLQEVIDHYSDHVLPSLTLSPSLKDTVNRPVNMHLTPGEKADLLAFLRMLTDSGFIADPRFSDPFANADRHTKTDHHIISE